MREEGRGDGIASLIETAKINGVEPFGYGKATLEAIARIRALRSKCMVLTRSATIFYLARTWPGRSIDALAGACVVFIDLRDGLALGKTVYSAPAPRQADT